MSVIPLDDDPLAATACLPSPERERVRAIVPERDRLLLLARRQCLLIELGAIEVYLGMERSVVPKHQREEYGAIRK